MLRLLKNKTPLNAKITERRQDRQLQTHDFTIFSDSILPFFHTDYLLSRHFLAAARLMITSRTALRSGWWAYSKSCKTEEKQMLGEPQATVACWSPEKHSVSSMHSHVIAWMRLVSHAKQAWTALKMEITQSQSNETNYNNYSFTCPGQQSTHAIWHVVPSTWTHLSMISLKEGLVMLTDNFLQCYRWTGRNVTKHSNLNNNSSCHFCTAFTLLLNFWMIALRCFTLNQHAL